MNVEKLEITTGYDTNTLDIKTITSFDISVLNKMISVLSEEDYMLYISETIAKNILEELERRLG